MTAVEAALSTQLQKRLVEEKERATKLIIGGTCQDHSEYRYSCGYIKALDDVATIAKELLEDMQKA